MPTQAHPIIAEFLQYLQTQNRANTTIQGYRSDLIGFKKWFEQTNMEPFALPNVTSLDLREYRQHLQVHARLKPATINRKLAALSALLKWAQSTGQIEADPARQIKTVPLVPSSPCWLDRREQAALLRAIEKDQLLSKYRYPKRWLTRQRDASLVVLLLNTGLRLQEALQTQLDDLELNARSGQITVGGKGQKVRTVPLNSIARGALKAWLEVRPSDRGIYIWTAVESPAEGPLSSRSAERIVRRYGDAAGLKNLSPHMLRHTFAKNLVDQGIGLERVATLLGHSSLNTTRIYTTTNQRDLAADVEKLAGW